MMSDMRPTNDAGRLIISAQSVVKDLQVQKAQIQDAMDRQLSMIETLLPAATWDIPEQPIPEPTPPEPDPESEPKEE